MARHPIWNLVGRVHFNLAENRKDAEAPFAFLASYTSRMSAYGKAQHLPLSKALAEFSDGTSQARLLSLLMPVQRTAEQCGRLRAMVESGEIYHPLRWLPADAHQFLGDVPKLEAAGIIVRAPGTWQAGRPARSLVKASIGARQPEGLAQVSPGADLKTTLRPNQQVGVRRLYLLTRLGLRACLADEAVRSSPGKPRQITLSAKSAGNIFRPISEVLRWEGLIRRRDITGVLRPPGTRICKPTTIWFVARLTSFSRKVVQGGVMSCALS